MPTFNALNTEHFAANAPPISLPTPPTPPSRLPDVKLDKNGADAKGPSPPPCNVTVKSERVYQRLFTATATSGGGDSNTTIVPADAVALGIAANLSDTWAGTFDLQIERPDGAGPHDGVVFPPGPPGAQHFRHVFSLSDGTLPPGPWKVTWSYAAGALGDGNVDVVLARAVCQGGA